MVVVVGSAFLGDDGDVGGDGGAAVAVVWRRGRGRWRIGDVRHLEDEYYLSKLRETLYL